MWVLLESSHHLLSHSDRLVMVQGVKHYRLVRHCMGSHFVDMVQMSQLESLELTLVQKDAETGRWKTVVPFFYQYGLAHRGLPPQMLVSAFLVCQVLQFVTHLGHLDPKSAEFLLLVSGVSGSTHLDPCLLLGLSQFVQRSTLHI
jgi:hypothetical protein